MTAEAPANRPSLLSPFTIAYGALFCATGTILATDVPFFGGVLFGTVYFTVQPLVEAALGFMGTSEIAKAARVFTSILAAIAAAAALTSLVGYDITFTSGLVLTLASIVASCVMNLLCAAGSTAIALGYLVLCTPTVHLDRQ